MRERLQRRRFASTTSEGQPLAPLHPHRTLLLAAVGIVGLLAAGCPTKKLKHPACAGDKDCKEGERCENQRCVAKKAGCESDADCEDGQVCKNNQCVPCEADGECGEAGQCQNGKCLREGECTTDSDCPEDEDCVNGQCVTADSQVGGGDLPSCKLSTVFFAFDQAGIGDESKSILQENATCLLSTERGVAIVGHTDPRGTDEYNIALSDKRARFISNYLSRLGVDQDRVRTIPKGESEAAGSDEDGWKRDRKVEFAWE